MNYNLDKTYYKNEVYNLSDSILAKDWRKLRKLHMKGVIHYEDEGKIYYQCSCCKQFHSSLDLHDFWHFDDMTTRRLDSLENLCFVCHAMNHLERIYDLDGNLTAGSYRGIPSENLIASFKNKVKALYNRDYDEMLKEILDREKARKAYLDENKVLIENKYTLIDFINQSSETKDPIRLKSFLESN